MEDTAHRAIAIVGVSAILPDAPNAQAFWKNITSSRYCITEVSPDRWNPDFYYDADPYAPDKTYSKIGGWVREFPWEPMKWKLPIPPRVTQAMDEAQQWALACTREVLEDYGYPKRSFDPDRTAVILGNAMAGEKHYLTALRVAFPEYAHELAESASFAALPKSLQEQITRELHARIEKRLPEITEDSMPGELANCLAGRIANIFNLHGPNFTADAACASTMAALSAAFNGLADHDFDVAVAGGIDRNMGAPTFVKFCKIGALSATGTRPFAEGADGFVMGEGAALFMLKRLADAERDGDRIYAVLRGIGGASDGKGKGITAPNPVGQRIAVERAWKNAGLSPATVGLMEGHGTSTKVGDVVEVQSMVDVLKNYDVPMRSIALGSVKSNIGHLKGAAGAAGLLKAALALHYKVLPPSVNCPRTNPDIDFAHSPFHVNTELRPWDVPEGVVRRAGLSAFGFGGTNFHLVLEEHIPGRLNGIGKRTVAVPSDVPVTCVPSASASGAQTSAAAQMSIANACAAPTACKAPLRGALVIGTGDTAALAERLRAVQQAAAAGTAPAPGVPKQIDLDAPERIAIDYGDAAELTDKSAKALKAMAANLAPVWKALRAQGIFRGSGPKAKVAFLYTGQGSQYVNMAAALREVEPIVAQTFEEANHVLTPLLGKPLTEYIFNGTDAESVANAEEALKQTAITQPAVIATDVAITRLLAAYGVEPDMTMGHSVGEYGALVAAGALPFEDAMEAVSARGREMTKFTVKDNGRMAAVFAPLNVVEETLKTIDGYVVIANINSTSQSVIGGASDAVERAINAFLQVGYNAVPLPVSHAFHTAIVAPASEPLKRMLQRLRLQSPKLPLIANINGEFYPTGPDVRDQMIEMLSKQVASPVQFVKGLRTLYEAGARVFVECGPKKALQGFADDVLGPNGDVVSLFTNHPKLGDSMAFNQALCGLYAAGLGRGQLEADREVKVMTETISATHNTEQAQVPATVASDGDAMKRPADNPRKAPVVISGAALGLPGTEHIFDDANIGRILDGEMFIHAIPSQIRKAMLDKNITRLVKSDNGGAFETIDKVEDVIKLAGRGGILDIEKEYGISSGRAAAFDRVTCLAVAAGIDALRDAGIPLVMRYRVTSKGTQLPDRWVLPETMQDDTGVIFASVFPGFDSFADELARYHQDCARRDKLATLEGLLQHADGNAVSQQLKQQIKELRIEIENTRYLFDRRFLFRALSMGHSQFAELIAARGPNTQINSACASTAQAVALAEDWIHSGRCRRVIVVAGDDVTSDHLLEWMGAGFLASGAAATDENVEEAATPFDRRRHGMIVGMGAAAIVIESAEAMKERGIQPICEVLSAVTANSAYHGTRLDVQHICQVMEDLVVKAESVSAVSRTDLAKKMVFVSHETYTPARGGSASAEINALRRVFGDAANEIVIANTKGLTGHTMGVGIEDVVAVKSLEAGLVPRVPNFKEEDPELGNLNLSQGGSYPIEYALRLAAGFGSQVSMLLMRRVPVKDGSRPAIKELGHAYRITDVEAWNAWIGKLAQGKPADLEVVNRTLRVRDPRFPAIATASGPVATPSIAVRESAETAPTAEANVAVGMELPAPAKSIREPMMPLAVAGVATTAELATDNSVKERVLALVAEKTGYPVDMLDLDLDLEADLGVDTVKQAEVFATVREAYAIPRDETVKLRDFPTLAHVIRFVNERCIHRTAPASLSAAAVTSEGKTGLPAAPTPGKVEAPAPAPTVAAPAVAVQTEEAIREKVLEIVAEKTGYPKDMLDLDLDLEADLGVDTVKQAEMFVAVRAAYNIPRDENLKLRDFPTLSHVIRFAVERQAVAAAKVQAISAAAPLAVPVSIAQVKPEAPATVAAPEVALQTEEAIREKVLEIVAEKTGYPKDMLDLDLDLEADLGVDTVKQAEMFVAVRAAYDIPRDENLKLRDFPTLNHVIRFALEKQAGVSKARAAVTPVAAVAATEPTATVAGQSPAPVVAAPEVVTQTEEAIREKVLEIVAEKTGYPKDMLDLDLDLEADLGVDTVKQAEMFVAVRAAYNIPREENLKLRDFPTLNHVIRFALEKQGGAVKAQTATTIASAQPPAVQHSITSAPILRPKVEVASFDAAEQIPRRVPVPVLRPSLDLCKSSGVKLGPGSRVVLMPDEGGVANALAQKLQALGVEVLQIEGALGTDAIINQLKSWAASGPIQGVYWLPALDHEGKLHDLDLPRWREALRRRVKALYMTMRALYEQIAAPGTFLVSATLLGGQHGYDAAGAFAPLGGPVVGITKTYKRERDAVQVKAVDFEIGRALWDIAEILIQETLRDPGAVEIGYKGSLRWSVGLQEQPVADGKPGVTLDSNSVFVVTGAAGSIVSAITADLASASGGTFYLLDLVPEPDPNNSDLKRFVADKDGLKREIFGRIQARGERATPALVERELAALERAQAAVTAINAVRSAGGTVHYFSVNLTDAAGIAKVIEQVRARNGRIDVLLHAAGLERSHFLPDKDPREFDLVFDVKSDGWFNLLRAIGDMPLGATVCFSSIAGRFGNGGQADYSSANDLLCKITSSFRTTKPNTRGIVIDWTAWGGIGMATRGSIPKMMELAGIDMLPPEAGVPYIRRELTCGSTRGEVVVGQRLGMLLKEFDETGGLDTELVAKFIGEHSQGTGPMIGKVTSMGLHSGLTIEVIPDPTVQGFLHDHQIDGTPVLPGVMGIESFAEIAQLTLPDWHVECVEDVNFMAPFKFYRNQPRTVTVNALITQCGDAVIANCKLLGSRLLPKNPEPEVTTHFTARVRLTKKSQTQLVREFILPSGPHVNADEIYKIYFHGPAYQVLKGAWRTGNSIVGEMSQKLPANHQPSYQPTLIAPRLIELCFQTAGLWEISVDNRMGLPLHVERVRLLRTPLGAQGPLYSMVTPRQDGYTFDAEVVDLSGSVFLQMEGYKTVALPVGVNSEPLKALRAVAAAV